MKAAFIKSISDLELREVSLPALEPTEIRMKIDACGICGSDVTFALDGKEKFEPIGHEVAGRIVELGSAVDFLSTAQTFVLDSSTPCGRCLSCKDAKPELCTDVKTFLYKQFHGIAEEMISPAISAVPYDGLSPEIACLAEPLGVAIDLHRCSDVQVGSHVVVLGLGPIGLMALRLAKLSGAGKIYACDLSKSKIRFETALAFGADEIIEVDKTPIESYKFEKAPDRIMVTSPPKTIPPMLSVAGRGAIVSFIGIKFGEGASISFDANDFHFKKLQLRGSFLSPALYTPFALRLLSDGSIDGKALVTHTFGLADVTEAFRVAAYEPDKAIKVVIVNG